MTDATNQPRTAGAQGRVQSGIPRLDDILMGGLMVGSTYSLVGPPGSGKTLLANQLCFNHVARGEGRCVYVTLLVESHTKLFSHLSSMEWFSLEAIPDQIYYVSGYESLRSGGLKGLMHMVQRTLREQRANLLIIDGMDGVMRRADSPEAYVEFVHELMGHTAMAEATTLLLSNARGRDHLEHGVVDGVLELSDQLVGPRAVRELTVHKFRGSDYQRGRHEVEIKSSGLVIHPRTEVQFNAPPEVATEERIRMAFGIKRLDEMMLGGLPSGSTTALLGAPGSGKTILGLSFLVEGARQGQKGIYFGFYEPPPRLIEKAEQVGIPLREHVESGQIELLWQPPLEHFMDSLAEQLLEKIRAEHSPRRRLFIDGVEGFRAAAVYLDRMPRFLSAFTNQLRMLDVTTVLSEELELFRTELQMPNPELANVVESVVLLRYVELRSQLFRLVSVMKMRESRYDTSIREFEITDDGVVVSGSFQSAEQILSGQARLTNGKRGASSSARRAPTKTRRAPTKTRRAPAKARRGRSGR